MLETARLDPHPHSHALADARGRVLHDLRISVTDKCNFRCTYCMPEDRYPHDHEFLSRHDLLTFEEIARFTRLAIGMGVSKVRITGGEPLLRKNLPVLIEMLANLPGLGDLALTTNGILLPRFAKSLRDAGLRRVTISLDTLDPAVFASMSGQSTGPDAVLAAIDHAAALGFAPIKINAVVQRGVNEDHVVDLAARFRGTGHIVRFIEYMDVGTCNGWTPDQVVPSRETLARIHARFPVEPLDKNYHGEVAERYRYTDGAGEIGFISSVSEPFCGACTRARLSADGKVFLCLFAADGVDVRTALRNGATDAELAALLEETWRKRDDRYSELRATAARTPAGRVEMYHIGG
ncbi:MAG: GTP 3',8-cyclase MoaA [Candidatus Hydrogenedentes bacterium]|nr:GTP 3',8-cyclase MoaA [Candidatus Hydrogenedentota bacterium]